MPPAPLSSLSNVPRTVHPSDAPIAHDEVSSLAVHGRAWACRGVRDLVLVVRGKDGSRTCKSSNGGHLRTFATPGNQTRRLATEDCKDAHEMPCTTHLVRHFSLALGALFLLVSFDRLLFTPNELGADGLSAKARLSLHAYLIIPDRGNTGVGVENIAKQGSAGSARTGNRW